MKFKTKKIGMILLGAAWIVVGSQVTTMGALTVRKWVEK